MRDFPHTKLISQRNHQQGSGKPKANQPQYPEFPLPVGGDGRGPEILRHGLWIKYA